jgi:cytidine deaminase
MKTKNIAFTWKEYESESELERDDQELVKAAKAAAQNAYAPYSKFKVGAALRLDNGVIVKGSNVENAAFPSGICAEKNVLATSASNYSGNKPLSLAVAAYTSESLTKEPVSPCGNCRQTIAEEEYRNNCEIKVILVGESKIIVVDRGGDLLPLQFTRNFLKINSH